MKILLKICVASSMILILEASANAPSLQEFYSPDQWERPEFEQVFPQELNSNPLREYQGSSFKPNTNDPGQYFNIYRRQPLGYSSLQPPLSSLNTYRSAVADPVTPLQSQPATIVPSGDSSSFKIFHIPLTLGSQKDQTIKLPIPENVDLSGFGVAYLSPRADSFDGSSGISSHGLNSQLSNRQNQDKELTYVTKFNTQNDGNQETPTNIYSGSKVKSNAIRSFGNQDGAYSSADFNFQMYSSPGYKNNLLKLNPQDTNYGASQDLASAASRVGNKGTDLSSSNLYNTNINPQKYGTKAVKTIYSDSKAFSSAASNVGNQDRVMNANFYPTKNFPYYENDGVNQQDINLGATEATANAIRSFGNQYAGYGNRNPNNINTYPKNEINQLVGLNNSYTKGTSDLENSFTNQTRAYNNADVYLAKISPSYVTNETLNQQSTTEGTAQAPASVIRNAGSKGSRYTKINSNKANNSHRVNQGVISATSLSDVIATASPRSNFRNQDREYNNADIYSTKYSPGFINYGVAPKQQTTKQDRSYVTSPAIASTRSIDENQDTKYSFRNSYNGNNNTANFRNQGTTPANSNLKSLSSDASYTGNRNVATYNPQFLHNNAQATTNTKSGSISQGKGYYSDGLHLVSASPYNYGTNADAESRMYSYMTNQNSQKHFENQDSRNSKPYTVKDNSWNESGNQNVDRNFGNIYTANDNILKDSGNQALHPSKRNSYSSNDNNWKGYGNQADLNNVDHNVDNLDSVYDKNQNDSRKKHVDFNIDKPNPTNDNTWKDFENQVIDINISELYLNPDNDNNLKNSRNKDLVPNIDKLYPVNDYKRKDTIIQDVDLTFSEIYPTTYIKLKDSSKTDLDSVFGYGNPANDDNLKESGNQEVDYNISNLNPAQLFDSFKDSENQDLDHKIRDPHRVKDNSWKDSRSHVSSINSHDVTSSEPTLKLPTFTLHSRNAKNTLNAETTKSVIEHTLIEGHHPIHAIYNTDNVPYSDKSAHKLSIDGTTPVLHTKYPVNSQSQYADAPLIISFRDLYKKCNSPPGLTKEELDLKFPNIQVDCDSESSSLTKNSRDSTYSESAIEDDTRKTGTTEDGTRETIEVDIQPISPINDTYSRSNDMSNSSLEPKPNYNSPPSLSSEEAENPRLSRESLLDLTPNVGIKNLDYTEPTLDGSVSNDYVNNTSKKPEENVDINTNVTLNSFTPDHQTRHHHNFSTKYSNSNSLASASTRPAPKLPTLGGINETVPKVHPYNLENNQSTNESASSVIHFGYTEITQSQPADSLNFTSYNQYESTNNPLKTVTDEYDSESPNSPNGGGSSGLTSNSTNSSYNSSSFNDGMQLISPPINETYVFVDDRSSSAMEPNPNITLVSKLFYDRTQTFASPTDIVSNLNSNDGIDSQSDAQTELNDSVPNNDPYNDANDGKSTKVNSTVPMKHQQIAPNYHQHYYSNRYHVKFHQNSPTKDSANNLQPPSINKTTTLKLPSLRVIHGALPIVHPSNQDNNQYININNGNGSELPIIRNDNKFSSPTKNLTDSSNSSASFDDRTQPTTLLTDRAYASIDDGSSSSLEQKVNYTSLVSFYNEVENLASSKDTDNESDLNNLLGTPIDNDPYPDDSVTNTSTHKNVSKVISTVANSDKLILLHQTAPNHHLSQHYYPDGYHIGSHRKSPTKDSEINSQLSSSSKPIPKLPTPRGIHGGPPIAHPRNSENTQYPNTTKPSYKRPIHRSYHPIRGDHHSIHSSRHPIHGRHHSGYRHRSFANKPPFNLSIPVVFPSVHSSYPKYIQFQHVHSDISSSENRYGSHYRPLAIKKGRYDSELSNSSADSLSSNFTNNPHSTNSVSVDDDIQTTSSLINDTDDLIKNKSSSSLQSKPNSDNNEYNNDTIDQSDNQLKSNDAFVNNSNNDKNGGNDTQFHSTAIVSQGDTNITVTDSKSNTSSSSHSQTPYHDNSLDDSSKNYSSNDKYYIYNNTIPGNVSKNKDEKYENDDKDTKWSSSNDSGTFTPTPVADSIDLTSEIPSLSSKIKQITHHLTSLFNSWLADYKLKPKSTSTSTQSTDKSIAKSKDDYYNGPDDVSSDLENSDWQSHFKSVKSKTYKKDTFENAHSSAVDKDRNENAAVVTSSEAWNEDQTEDSAEQESKAITSKTSTSDSSLNNEAAKNSFETDYSDISLSRAIKILAKIIASIEKLLGGHDEDKL